MVKLIVLLSASIYYIICYVKFIISFFIADIEDMVFFSDPQLMVFCT